MATKTVRFGITLIETLCVVAIVIVLVAMVFPLASKSTERGRMVVCASNLRQLYAALVMYSEDQGGMSCPPLKTDAMLPYVKEASLFRCPSSTLYAEFDGKYRADVLDFLGIWEPLAFPVSYGFIRFAEPAGEMRVWNKLLESRVVGVFACMWHGPVSHNSGVWGAVRPRSGPIQRVTFSGGLYTLPKRKHEQGIAVADLYYSPENPLHYVL